VRVFIRRCAWHPKYHGYSKILGITWSGWAIEFSHGICSDCAARTRAEWRLPSAAEPAVAAPPPRRPLRSLRPDFALAAAVVLLAVTATFALVGMPALDPRAQRSAAVDRSAIDETSPVAAAPSMTSASPDSGSTGSAARSGGVPSSTPSSSAPSPSSVRPSPTPTPPAQQAAPQVAEGRANEPSRSVSAGGGSGRGRVARVRGRGVASGAAVVPVSAPEMCPCQGDQIRQVAAAPTPIPAAAPDPVVRKSDFGRHQAANRFNEVQAP
jgi:hypothetical protein